MAYSQIPDPARLSALVTQWRARRCRLLPETRKAPHTHPHRLARVFAAFAAPLESHRERLRHNPWNMARLGRYEVRNAAVLAQLWDPVLSGPSARRFLRSYLARLADPAGQLPTPDQLARPFRIRTEHCPTGNRSERVDITIEGEDFLLGIDVKIDAGEGHEQLVRYG